MACTVNNSGREFWGDCFSQVEIKSALCSGAWGPEHASDNPTGFSTGQSKSELRSNFSTLTKVQISTITRLVDNNIDTTPLLGNGLSRNVCFYLITLGLKVLVAGRQHLTHFTDPSHLLFTLNNVQDFCSSTLAYMSFEYIWTQGGLWLCCEDLM